MNHATASRILIVGKPSATSFLSNPPLYSLRRLDPVGAG